MWRAGGTAHATLLAGEFGHQTLGAIELAQRFGHGGGVDGYGAVGGAVIDEVADQGFNVAVENQADNFTLGVDYRRTGIAANDVVGGDEIQRCGQVELVAAFLVARGQIERPLVIEAGGAIV